MVTVNTERGKNAFEEIKHLLDIVESTYENASSFNSSWAKSTSFPKSVTIQRIAFVMPSKG